MDMDRPGFGKIVHDQNRVNYENITWIAFQWPFAVPSFFPFLDKYPHLE